MRRRGGPVQQWVDSIPSPTNLSMPNPNKPQEDLTETPNMSMTPTEPKDIPFPTGTKVPTMTVSAPINVPSSPSISTTGLPSSLPYRLARDPSLQSDSSHCSSVESLLELRKADPEAILLGLGFGGYSNSPQENGSLSRIPKRFLQPSRLKGIAINDFVKHQQETTESFDSVSLGYRGLTGSPYVAPSEIVQKIMDRLREHESHETDPYAMYNCYEQYSPIQQNGQLSVLSPDNRQFLERPRSKSPDMCNKRMIIGQKSFAFGHDGDLIEIDFSNSKEVSKNGLKKDREDADNSDAHKNEDLNTERNEVLGTVPASKTEKRLSKQISFNDNIEICHSDFKSITQTYEKRAQGRNVDPDCKVFREANITNTSYDDKNEDIASNHSEVRRASDGSCKVTFPEYFPTREGRRHSDSVVHAIENSNSEYTLSQKRRTLKRQPRVCDIDALDYCELNTFVSSTPTDKHSRFSLHDRRNAFECDKITELKQSESGQGADDGEKLFGENESCDIKIPEASFEGTHRCAQAVDETLSDENVRLRASDNCNASENQLSRDEEKTEELCTHGDDCTRRCCHTHTAKYWKNMDKIMKKNKKLETMVAKNTREMAEIREMLNSVLSVRMEPGF